MTGQVAASHENQYSLSNRKSEKDWVDFINKLSTDQLAAEMPAGWTVMAVLAHVAFWDIRAQVLIKKWQSEGISESSIDTDVINEVTRPIFIGLDPEQAVKVISASAKNVDSLIDSLSEEFINEIKDHGKNVHLDRSKHRYMHIYEIKSALGI